MAVITLNGVKKEYPAGTTFEAIANEYQEVVKSMMKEDD